MKRLKEKWGIESNFQIVIIFIVFAINGSLAVYLTKPVLSLINISKETTHGLIYWPVRIIVIFIIYQITLVIVGTLFGQKKVFLEYQFRPERRAIAIRRGQGFQLIVNFNIMFILSFIPIIFRSYFFI